MRDEYSPGFTKRDNRDVFNGILVDKMGAQLNYSTFVWEKYEKPIRNVAMFLMDTGKKFENAKRNLILQLRLEMEETWKINKRETNIEAVVYYTCVCACVCVCVCLWVRSSVMNSRLGSVLQIISV